jgi:hypothetical protein
MEYIGEDVLGFWCHKWDEKGDKRSKGIQIDHGVSSTCMQWRSVPFVKCGLEGAKVLG